jgi:hypothetical protein
VPTKKSSKQSTKKRVKVKALPKKSKKLSEGEMKKVKGGGSMVFLNRNRQKEL